MGILNTLRWMLSLSLEHGSLISMDHPSAIITFPVNLTKKVNANVEVLRTCAIYLSETHS